MAGRVASPAGRRSYLDVRLSYQHKGSQHEVGAQSAGSQHETELPVGTHLDVLVSPGHPDLVEGEPRNSWLEIDMFGGGLVFLGFAALSRKLA